MCETTSAAIPHQTSGKRTSLNYLTDPRGAKFFVHSWIGSVQLGFLFMLGLVAGTLFDAGYFHHIMIFGCALFTFSMFMLSLAQPQQFYQVRALHYPSHPFSQLPRLFWLKESDVDLVWGSHSCRVSNHSPPSSISLLILVISC